MTRHISGTVCHV